MLVLLISLLRGDSNDSIIDDSVIYEDLDSLSAVHSDLIDMDIVNSNF